MDFTVVIGKKMGFNGKALLGCKTVEDAQKLFAAAHKKNGNIVQLAWEKAREMKAEAEKSAKAKK